MLAVALCTLKDMSQLPVAGMFAPDSVTLPDVLVSDSAAPPQVLAGACGPNVTLAGKDTDTPDWVSAKPLVLPKVTTSTAGIFAATLAGENAALTVGGAGVTVMGAIQAEAAVPAADGAGVVALLAVNVTVAVSWLPDESVTTRVRVPAPVAITFTVELDAPETM